MVQFSAHGPWGSLDQLRREMNALLDRGTGAGPAYGRSRGVYPPTNLYETSDAYILTAELPGVETGDIHVSLEDSTVAISGERKTDLEAYQDANLHRRERQAGSFRRAFTLPAKIDRDKIEAMHKNGVLVLRVPKSPDAEPRQISVQAS